MTTAPFLSLFGARFTFQTFDDSPRKLPSLSRILHGTLPEHAVTLAALNAEGAGVFFMVNEGDGLGRKVANVQRVRALFVDLDGSPIAPVQAASLLPHCVVQSSPGRWHAYWLVADCPLESFKPLQHALAERFNADRKVCDLPRVMRLPGFEHRKAKPFTSRVVTFNANSGPYELADVTQALALNVAPLALPVRKRRTLSDAVPQGERNVTLLSLAAGLVRTGHDAQAVNGRLQRINAERCQPPLCPSEVEAIAAQAVGYGSEGFVMLPHKLLDSPQWKGLPPPAQVVILAAFRRFNGTNNGNIALTPADFDGLPGMTPGTFKRHRKRALSSGILRLAKQGLLTQTGRTPDLYAIADCWLPNSAGCKNGTLRMVQKGNSYIDKQAIGVEGSHEGAGRERRHTKTRAA